MSGHGGAGDHPRTADTPRPRYGRLSAAGGAALVTLVSVLGGIGVLPTSSAAARPVSQGSGAVAASPVAAVARPTGTPSASATGSPTASVSKPPAAQTADQSPAPAVPARSGTGRRVVFDMSDQRVWLVGRHAGADAVRRTYLVSGSVTDNLAPGRYAVYSRSLRAVGVDDSGTMRYMVRFTQGQNAAIGFHDIPVLDGRLVQTRDDLGTPQSHGCIRQWRPDARALWAFAPVGTRVVVVA